MAATQRHYTSESLVNWVDKMFSWRLDMLSLFLTRNIKFTRISVNYGETHAWLENLTALSQLGEVTSTTCGFQIHFATMHVNQTSCCPTKNYIALFTYNPMEMSSWARGRYIPCTVILINHCGGLVPFQIFAVVLQNITWEYLAFDRWINASQTI